MSLLLLALAAAALVALVWWGTSGQPNDPATGGASWGGLLGRPPILDESDRDVVGPSDEEIARYEDLEREEPADGT